MKNFKISKKLGVAFATIGGMMGLIVIMVILGFVVVSGQFEKFYSAHQVTNEAMDARRSIQAAAKGITSAFSLEDEAKTKKYIDSATEELSGMQQDLEFLRENFTGDIKLIEQYETIMLSGVEIRKQIMELALVNQNVEATSLYFDKYSPILLEANSILDQIFQEANKIAEQNHDVAIETIIIVVVIMLVIAATAVLVMVKMALYIVKSIQKPIRELEVAAEKLSEGNVDIEITYESKDELGNLAESFRKTCAFLKLVIQDANRLLRSMAEGNFNIGTKCEDAYIGEFDNLKNSMRMLNRKLNDILTNINNMSEQVAEGSNQMALSAQEVAEGATEQAGAVEELQATIANVSESIHQSTQSGEEASRQAGLYSLEAQNSKQEMEQMVAAMTEISEMSAQIGNIIENIEDIASQTNLLSLNASIEAARAGEAGRGFAVVAQQIGKLAEDSAKAALNTRELIVNSIEKIKSGNQIAEKTADSLDKVVSGIAELAKMAKAVSEASLEQEKAMGQIEQGVEQISEVVQSNSAASEETSAASEELSAHAANLKEMVQQFQLRK